jgi:hypothetical protein
MVPMLLKILDDSKQKMLGPAGTTSSLLINGNGTPAMERRNGIWSYQQNRKGSCFFVLFTLSNPKRKPV